MRRKGSNSENRVSAKFFAKEFADRFLLKISKERIPVELIRVSLELFFVNAVQRAINKCDGKIEKLNEDLLEIVLNMAPTLKSSSSLLKSMSKSLEETLEEIEPNSAEGFSADYLDYVIIDSQYSNNNYSNIESHDLP